MSDDPRPQAAFLLSLVGLLFHVVLVAFVVVFVTLAAGPPFEVPGTAPRPLSGQVGIFVLWLVAAAAILLLGAAGTSLLNGVDPGRVRLGALLVLAVAMLAFPTLWGLFVGSLLMFVGALLGLAWTPSGPSPAPGS